MNMNKIAVVTSKEHRLHERLIKLPNTFEYSKNLNLDDFSLIFDFSLCHDEDWYKKYGKNLIADLTLIKHDHLDLRGKFSALFHSPTNSIELVCKEEDEVIIKNFFNHLDMSTVKVTDPKLSFTFPRIVAQIMNEAYFALKENIASASDIDRAMIFGVNYPLGPLDWLEKTQSKHVSALLKMLEHHGEKNRYKTLIER